MKFRISFWLLAVALSPIYGSIFLPTIAQVTTDGTTSTTVTATDTGVQIENGERNGDNLFHSFDDFSVPTNTEAHFNNANDVVNIFSRVTGGNISNINGILRANGTANLFLINPAGILLGENARLQLGGSFYGSTADSIIFPDGEFRATDLENPPLITINAPIGLGFRDNPNSITVRGNGNGVRLTDSELIDTQEALRVDSNATIGLIGGELTFEDATLKTAGGRIELGSVAGGKVDLVAVANGLTFDYSGVDNFQDISLSGTSVIDASGLGSGDIQVAGKNITVGDISGIEANTLGGETAGDIQIFASESLTISGIENENNFLSGISNRVFPQGTADGGDINIEVQNLSIGDRAAISTFLSGQGNAGNINIAASESVSLVSEGNTTAITSGINVGTLGNGGNINITTPNLTLSNGAFLSSNTSGQGNAGNITIEAINDVSLIGQDNFANIFTGVNLGAVGNGGAINITTGSLILQDGATLDTTTSGQGNAGNVIIEAAENIFLDGQDDSVSIFTGVGTDAIGNGGTIGITTGSLSLQNDATFITSSSGDGNAGNVIVNARESISFDGQGNSNGILSGAVASSTGKSGDIELSANSLTLNNGSAINNFSVNQVGDISLNVTENISFTNNSSIFASGAGQGSVTIEAKNLEIVADSNIFAGIAADLGSAESQAGDIVINLAEDLSIDSIGGETTSIANNNFGTGNAGNIELNARNIFLLNGGQIASNLVRQGSISSINLNATEDIFIDGATNNSGSQVLQFVNPDATGNIGSINIQAQNLTLTNGGQISSEVAGTANSGDINISVADKIIVDGFAELAFEDSTTNFLSSEINTNVGVAANGDSGDINISSKNLSLSRNGQVNSTIFGQGNAGNININAEIITIGEQGNINRFPSNISSQALSDSSNPELANAGNISISTSSLSIRDGGSINVGLSSTGDGGSIQITATDSVTIDGTGILENIENPVRSAISAFVSLGALANGGDIEINTANLFLSDRGAISTSSEGDGDAGNITLNVADTFLASNSSSVVSNIGNPQGVVASGKVGKIVINAKNIAFSDTAQIQAGAFSGATAEQTGIVSLTATESISFTGQNTGIFSNNDPGSSGDSSNTQLSAPIITLNNGAGIVADNRANDRGGNITVETEQLTMSNDSSIVVNTLGEGNAGSVTINALDSVLLKDISSIEAVVGSDATGNGGNITVETENLTLNDGSEISATTFGEGDAGSLNITATESIKLDGIQEQSRSGLFANALVEDGTGGNIFVFTNKLTISDGAIISASNFLTFEGLGEPGTGEAGSITIEANNIILENEGIINTATQAGDRGNIALKVTEDIILRENSLISARAFKDATGGNITIDTEFIFAFPSRFDGNDIRADAQQGKGGRIDITAESVFGIAESKTLNPLTNDINASSQVDGLEGTISINTPDVNALRGSSELPSNPISTNTLATTNACDVSSIEETSNLIVKGKGGILPEIINPLSADNLIIDRSTISLDSIDNNRARNYHFHSENAHDDAIKPAIETEETGKLMAARGIIKQEDGTVYLTAYPTSSRARTTNSLFSDCIY